MKVIGIVGSRRRNTGVDRVKVEKAFTTIYEDGDEIVSGGCPQGADVFAEYIAKNFQVPIKIYYAKWKKHGKAAGFMRNWDIARDADVLIACVAPDRTGGTEDTIKKFKYKCPRCKGLGRIKAERFIDVQYSCVEHDMDCPDCTGKVVLV